MGLKPKVVVPEEETEVGVELTEVEVEETTVAVTVAAPKEVAVVAPGVVPSLQELQDKWNTDEVGNVFKRITGTNGALYIEKTTLGEWADIQVFSHNARTMVVPVGNVPNDPAVKKNCRASYDHKTIHDRESGTNITIEEYAESIKEQFPKGVKVSKYHDIYCSVFACQKNLDAAKALGIAQVSVSPTAVKDLWAFIKTTRFRELQGVMLPSHRNCLRLVADARNKDGQNYVAIMFEPVPLDVLAAYTPILE